MRHSPTQQIERYARLLLVGSLIVGCCLVLLPFFSAILFAIVIAVSTWPAFNWLLKRLGGRRAVASLVACLAGVLALVGPAVILAVSARDAGVTFLAVLREKLTTGPVEPPEWLGSFPVIGTSLVGTWRNLLSGRLELTRTLQTVGEPLRDVAWEAGGRLGGGVLQLVLAVFLLFFLFRDGHTMADRLNRASVRVIGPRAGDLILIAQNTIRGVMLGLIGTAVVQGFVAMFGFMIAGVPAPLLLGAAVFVASVIPFGPVVIWGGAAIWLYADGQPGWAIFMALYGTLVISSVDNFVKPMLIARTSSLPIALTLLGVLGGIIAFGFMGLFIGPTVLALAVNIGGQWLDQQVVEDAIADGAIPPEAAGTTQPNLLASGPAGTVAPATPAAVVVVKTQDV